MENLRDFVKVWNNKIYLMYIGETQESEDTKVYTYQLDIDSSTTVSVQCVEFLNGIANIKSIRVEDWSMDNVAPYYARSVVTGDTVTWNIPQYTITWNSSRPYGLESLSIELRARLSPFERTAEGMVSLRF